MDARCAGVLQLLGRLRNVSGLTSGSILEEFAASVEEPPPRVESALVFSKPRCRRRAGSGSPEKALIRVSGSTSEDLVFR
jgi:hypothetical protein